MSRKITIYIGSNYQLKIGKEEYTIPTSLRNIGKKTTEGIELLFLPEDTRTNILENQQDLPVCWRNHVRIVFYSQNRSEKDLLKEERKVTEIMYWDKQCWVTNKTVKKDNQTLHTIN